MLVSERFFKLFRNNRGNFVPMSSFAPRLNILHYYIPSISNKVKLLAIAIVWNYSRRKLSITVCSECNKNWDNLA